MAAGDAFVYVDANVGPADPLPQPAITSVELNVGVPVVDRLSAYNYVDVEVERQVVLTGSGQLSAGSILVAQEQHTILDTFSRVVSDVYGTSPDLGTPWHAQTGAGIGDWSADGSKAIVTSDPTHGGGIATYGNVAGDMRFKATGVTITTVGTTATRSLYFIGKYVNYNNCVFIEVRNLTNGGVNFYLSKKIANVVTQVATLSGTQTIPSNQQSVTFDIELRLQGLNLSALVNGSVIVSGQILQSDADALATGTGIGINSSVLAAGASIDQLDAWVMPTPVTASATGTLSGSGQLSASAVQGGVGLASLSGSGQLSGSGTPNLPVPVALTGSGELSAIGLAETLVDVGLTGEGTLSAEGEAFIPFDPDDPTIPIQLVFSVVDGVLIQAPTAVVVSVWNGDPDEMYEFRIDGDVVYRARALPSGDLAMTSIPVDEEHGAAGSHTISVTQGSLYAEDTFTIRRAPNLVETAMGPDTAPVEPPSGVYRANGTRLWVLQDLMPGGLGTYIMPVNPDEMDNPAFERALSTRHATAKSGQWHIYEGAPTPLDWSFHGYCPTQEMHDKLHAFGNLNRRFYLIDHRERAWMVSFSQVDAVARLRENDIYGQESDWVHDYTVTAQIHNQYPGRAQ